MGYQVKPLFVVALWLAASPVAAQETDANDAGSGKRAAGIDFFASTDADQTDVFRAGVNFDVEHQDQRNYLGLRYEKAWYRPLGQATVDKDRLFVRAADSSGPWNWSAQVGTDGDTVIGAATIHDDARFRKEFFIERDIVETPRGVSDGIYYTFVGGAIDLPADDRNNFTLVAGAQEFTGKNVRLHARANYVHVVKPELGLSAQLRARYFHSTRPREFDYYSPRWYVQILPVAQMRRYSGGWRYMIAGGVGAQRDAVSDWRASYYAGAEVTSPEVGRDWYLKASALYNNIPQNSGAYDYGQFSIALTRAF